MEGFKLVPLCMHHQRADKAARLTDPMFTEDWAEAVALGPPMGQSEPLFVQGKQCHLKPGDPSFW